MTKKEKEKLEAIKHLKQFIKKGDTIFTKIEKGKIQLIKKIEHSRNNRTLILNETEIMNDWNKLKKYSDELSNNSLKDFDTFLDFLKK